MAGMDDTVADDGQPLTTPVNSIAGPGPWQMAVDVVAHEGNKTNNDQGTKDCNVSQRTFRDPPAAQKSPLLTIAPEIRNMIFKLCLFHQEDIVDKLGSKPVKDPKAEKDVEVFSMASYYPCYGPTYGARPRLQEAYEFSISIPTKKSVRQHTLRNLALMRTCQNIYNEAAPVLWSQRFTFRNILPLQNFLLSPHVRHDLVRDVKVLRVDNDIGINYMPAICALVADKLTGLEVFDVDMGHMRYAGLICDDPMRRHGGFYDDQHIKDAAKNLGFGIYSCMHPWVTKVVREKGIDKLMAILQIVRESDPICPLDHGNKRVYIDFRGRGQLPASERAMADAVTAEEILRLVDGYEKKLL